MMSSHQLQTIFLSLEIAVHNDRLTREESEMQSQYKTNPYKKVGLFWKIKFSGCKLKIYVREGNCKEKENTLNIILQVITSFLYHYKSK